MPFLRKLIIALTLNLALVTASGAATKPEEAKALVDKAVAYVNKVGTDKAFKEFNDPNGPWVKGELYILVYDFQGNNLVYVVQ